MNLPLINWRIKTIMLVLLFIIVARLLALGAYPLFDTTESRYAEIARKMVETSNWVTPQISYGVPYWGKPPLTFWLAAISIKLFGISDIAARLPSFLMAILIGCLIYYMAIKQRSRYFALTAALVLATTALFFIMAGQVTTDQTLAFGITLAMVTFWLALGETGPGGRIWGYLFFIGLAIGILAKGLVAFVFILVPIGAWAFWHKKWRKLLDRVPWVLGTILMLAIALPWYLLAEIRTPGFLHYFIVGEHWDRYTQSGWHGDLYGATHVHAYGMIWLYWVAAAFPWSLFFIAFLARLALPLGTRHTALAKDEWITYLSFWAVIPLIFFTFTSNILITYVLPILPAFSLLMAEALQRTVQPGNPEHAPLSSIKPAIIALAAPLLAFLVLFFYVPDASPYKSQKDLIERYKALRSDSSIPLIYLFDKPYSAEFYSQGKAAKIADINKATAYITGVKESFVVARDEDLRRMQPSLRNQLEPVGKFGHFELFRKYSG